MNAQKRNRLSFIVLVVATTLVHFQGAAAFAKGKKARTLPGGIVFPNLNQGATVNPATLNTQKGQSAQLLYSPPLDATQTAHDARLSYASSSKDFGLGLGYLANYDTELTSGMFVGGGFTTGSWGFGLSLTETDLQDDVDSSVDVGVSWQISKALQFALVSRNVIADERTVSAGIGFEKLGSYFLELNATTPALNALDGGDYLVSMIGGVYVGMFGASFTTTYNVGTDTTSNSLTGLVQMGSDLSLLLTMDMGTIRTYTFGLTYSF